MPASARSAKGSQILLGFQGSFPGDDWGQLAAGFGLIGVTSGPLVLMEVRLSWAADSC